MKAELKKLLDQVPPAPVVQNEKYVNAVIYGDYGVGKTVVAAQCVAAKGLVIATDTGTDSLFNHPGLPDKIDLVRYEGIAHLAAIAQAIEEGIAPYDQYDAVIVDTISQIQEEFLDFLLANYTFSGNDRRTAVAKRGTGLSDEEAPGFGDYRIVRDKMRPAIKSLIKAPVDVYFLAHLREPSLAEQQQAKFHRRPAITEAVFKVIASEASLLGLMERKGNERTIQFATDKKTVSKSRIAELDNKTIKAEELPEILQNWKVN